MDDQVQFHGMWICPGASTPVGRGYRDLPRLKFIVLARCATVQGEKPYGGNRTRSTDRAHIRSQTRNYAFRYGRRISSRSRSGTTPQHLTYCRVSPN